MTEVKYSNQHQMSTEKPEKILQRLRKTVMTSKRYVVRFLTEIDFTNR